jgi:hypothetical protein
MSVVKIVNETVHTAFKAILQENPNAVAAKCHDPYWLQVD